VEGVSDLADAVLPLIRTRADVWRWGAANEHGRQMHDAVAMLQAAAESEEALMLGLWVKFGARYDALRGPYGHSDSEDFWLAMQRL